MFKTRNVGSIKRDVYVRAQIVTTHFRYRVLKLYEYSIYIVKRMLLLLRAYSKDFKKDHLK